VRWQRLYISVLILLPCIGGSPGAATAETSIESLYRSVRDDSDSGVFIQPDSSKLHRFSRLFQSFVDFHERGEFQRFGELQTECDALGVMIRRTTGPEGVMYSVLTDLENRPQGTGFYVLADRSPDTRPVIVQAPHARSDAWTGLIGLEVFKGVNAAGFFSSTMRRNISAQVDTMTGESGAEDSDAADPCHNSQHFFQAATLGYGMKHPDMMILQFHGFKETGRDYQRHFDVVVSSGLEPAEEHAVHRKIKATVMKNLPDRRTALFGVQTRELGGLTNIQGHAVNSGRSGIFLHIELSRSYRESLMGDPGIMNGFVSMIRSVKRCYEKL